MSRKQLVQHIRGNNLTVAGGTIIASPAAASLAAGELAMNYNASDPTLFIGTVVNTGTTSTNGTGTTANAEFKSKAWLESHIVGASTSGEATYQTLQQITTTLGLMAADSDSVVNTWTEIKNFLSTIPDDSSYNVMSLLNNKASINFDVTTSTSPSGATAGTVTNIAKLYDGKSIVGVSATTSGVNYTQLKVNVGTIIPNTSTGEWIDGTYVLPTYSDKLNTSDRTPNLEQVRNFYNHFNEMFTLVGDTIRANYDFYSVGEVSAYGLGTGVTGGTGSGGSANVLGSTATGGTFSDADVTSTFNSYTIQAINNRLVAVEASGATTISVTGAGNAITNVTKSGTALTFTKGLTFLTGNQTITLTGDVTGTGTTSIATSIADNIIMGKVLTGYTSGTNTALASTDTIVGAFGKIQGQINSKSPTTGSTSINTVGAITGGSWTATDVALAHGGTNASLTASAGSIVYSNTTGMAFSTVGTTGYLLTSAASGAPTWTNPAIFAPSGGSGNIVAVGTVTAGTWNATTITVAKGGLNLTAITTDHMLYASSSNAYSTFVTSAFGRSLLNATSGTTFSGLNADMLDGLHTATANTASTVVARDSSGNFSAGTISAALTGNATTATSLKTARNISVSGAGFTTSTVSFDGSTGVTLTLGLELVDGGTW